MSLEGVEERALSSDANDPEEADGRTYLSVRSKRVIDIIKAAQHASRETGVDIGLILPSLLSLRIEINVDGDVSFIEGNFMNGDDKSIHVGGDVTQSGLISGDSSEVTISPLPKPSDPSSTKAAETFDETHESQYKEDVKAILKALVDAKDEHEEEIERLGEQFETSLALLLKAVKKIELNGKSLEEVQEVADQIWLKHATEEMTPTLQTLFSSDFVKKAMGKVGGLVLKKALPMLAP